MVNNAAPSAGEAGNGGGRKTIMTHQENVFPPFIHWISLQGIIMEEKAFPIFGGFSTIAEARLHCPERRRILYYPEEEALPI